MGTFLAVRGVSELHLWEMVGGNIIFWLSYSPRAAQGDIQETQDFLKKFRFEPSKMT